MRGSDLSRAHFRSEPRSDLPPLGFPTNAAERARIPNDWSVWAVGDVHGCLDALRLGLTRAGLLDAGGRWSAGAGVAVVGVGDYVGRGPDSAGVVTFLRGLARELASANSRLVLLRGNHEQMLADILRGSDEWFSTWTVTGGEACAQSFGVRARGRRMEDVQADLLAKDPGLLDWLLATLPYVTWRDVLFVHAGLVTDGTLQRLADSDLQLWDPGAYYNSKGLAVDPAYAGYRRDGIRARCRRPQPSGSVRSSPRNVAHVGCERGPRQPAQAGVARSGEGSGQRSIRTQRCRPRADIHGATARASSVEGVLIGDAFWRRKRVE